MKLNKWFLLTWLIVFILTSIVVFDLARISLFESNALSGFLYFEALTLSYVLSLILRMISFGFHAIYRFTSGKNVMPEAVVPKSDNRTYTILISLAAFAVSCFLTYLILSQPDPYGSMGYGGGFLILIIIPTVGTIVGFIIGWVVDSSKNKQ